MSDDFRETLYTIDKQGRRKWVYSALVAGRYFNLRRVVAYTLMAFYLLLPWVTIRGRQGVLLSFAESRFVFFGTEFWATDGYFLFLISGGLAFALFFFTALFGRLWCGWACPETVFLEFLFRPIERLIEGTPAQRKRLDQQPWNWEKIRKKFAKHSLCAFFSWIIASSTLAYFVGREPLLAMMSDWPQNHPVPFSMTLVLMGLMAFQFGWFREQFCTVLCPYARFQSVLMDSRSIVVGYDQVRGEPRSKVKKGQDGQDRGDCVDCGLCVRVCPTGIDIRNGLQLECVACTACVDACDSIMRKVGRPEGLIRYDTEDRLLGRDSKRRILRLRPVLYGVILLIFLGGFTFSLVTRPQAEFQILRGALDKPFTLLADGRVSNHFHVRVANKGRERDSYNFAVSTGFSNGQALELITPQSPFPVEGGKMETTPLFVNFPVTELTAGKRKLTISISGESGFSAMQEVTLLGPDE